MPSYGGFIMPPLLDDRPVAALPAPAAEAPAGTVCGLCANPNCSLPGACQ